VPQKLHGTRDRSVSNPPLTPAGDTTKPSKIQSVVGWLVLIIGCIIVLYALSKGICRFFDTVAVAAAVAGAALVSGGFLGFLFSIPRAVKTKTDVAYADNTNLEDISDWLTKILVGVGLATLTKIPSKCRAFANYIGASGFGNGNDGPIFVMGISVFSAVCGFLWTYHWTRVIFRRELTDAPTLSQIQDTMRSVSEQQSDEIVTTLAVEALDLSPAQRDPESELRREKARAIAEAALVKNPQSRKIAIQLSRLLEEQFRDRAQACKILEQTLEARRAADVPRDADDAALLFNLACYVNRDAKATEDPSKKEELRAKAWRYLVECAKINPADIKEMQEDDDLKDLAGPSRKFEDLGK
jgi:hypothetical protein